MIAEMNRTNDPQHSDNLIIESADVVALYPSLDINFTVDKMREVFYRSSVKIEEVDYQEVGLYLALNKNPEELRELGLAESCPVRKSNRGRSLTIIASVTEECQVLADEASVAETRGPKGKDIHPIHQIRN